MKNSAIHFTCLLGQSALVSLLLGQSVEAQDIPKQIIIETKFVEVTQKDLDELGFDWLLGPVNGGSLSGTSQPELESVSAIQRGSDNIGGFRFQKLNRGTSGNGNSYGGSSVLTDSQFQVVMRALEKGGNNLLSAPSVVTHSGQRANIEIIREFIYPTDYDPPEQPQTFFNGGETIFEIGGGAAMGGLSEGPEVFGTQQFEYNNQIFNQQVSLGDSNGLMNDNAATTSIGVTRFINNNLGFGTQIEWIQGDIDDAFLGRTEMTYRFPVEFKDFAIALYGNAGVGFIGGGDTDTIVGSVGAGAELRNKRNFGIFGEYTQTYLGDGRDFSQVLLGFRIVIGQHGSPPPSGVNNTKVALNVVPTVRADNHTIDLDLSPEVVEFEGFINYGSPIQTDGVAGGGPILVESDRVRGRPFGRVSPPKRRVVLQDGQTAVVGGFVTGGADGDTTGNKKIPILGDLPLIGRLFRTNVERHQKRNLTVFVTARLIDPAGRQ
tara:strand:- start:288 stop:1760 length:1473 start_codon:yes stop_codon:yes gene_type:complete